MPLARDQRPFKRRLEVVLKATRGIHNNIPYTIAISLKFAIPVLGKNLTIKILAFIVLLLIKGSLINLLRSNK